jgi:hypothetical protein
MMEPLEDILGGVLDTAEKAEKSRNRLYVFSVILEGMLLVAFLLVMDFGDRIGRSSKPEIRALCGPVDGPHSARNGRRVGRTVGAGNDKKRVD